MDKTSKAPTVAELLADHSTPFWVKDVIRVALDKDCVDAAGAFAVLAEVFLARC